MKRYCFLLRGAFVFTLLLFTPSTAASNEPPFMVEPDYSSLLSDEFTSLPDTYNQTGPFKVKVGVRAIEEPVVRVILSVLQNGEQVRQIEMKEIETDIYQGSFTIAGNPGDDISYFSIAYTEWGDALQTMPKHFKILYPANPYADILLVFNDVRNDSFYTQILNKLGYEYELWNYDLHRGIDTSVTNWGWDKIIIAGSSVNCIPTRSYEGNPFAAFLKSGKKIAPRNLLLASQDYIFANNESARVIFNAGDFAYDFFSLGSATSDSDPAKDSLFVGLVGDPISGSFAKSPLILNPLLSGMKNWIDQTKALGEGVDIFYSWNQGYSSGVRLDADSFKTVFLPWMMSMMLDSVYANGQWRGIPSPQASQLMINILSWFGSYVKVTRENLSGADKFSLSANHPNPFNSQTMFRVTLPRKCHVTIEIYNILGQRIKTVLDFEMPAGNQFIRWDGKDDAGQTVSTGIYFYRIRAGKFFGVHKMLFLP